MRSKLTDQELKQYREQGYVVLHDVVPKERLAAVIDETERMVDGARSISEPTAALDLDPAHTPAHPRLRRIKSPHQHSAFFHAFAAEPFIVDLLSPLMPSGVRVHNTKINMKSAGHGEAIEWHQDWAFYPHTNDDVLAVGLYLDDCTLENGPMLVIPGSHHGPVYNHHESGYFCGAISATDVASQVDKAIPLTGPAGTLTIHHARLLHGSAVNRSASPRRFLLQAYAAVDAWPLHDLKGSLEDFNNRIVKGEPCMTPRMAEAPVRIPLPLRPGVRAGSIYDNQSILPDRYFGSDEPASMQAD